MSLQLLTGVLLGLLLVGLLMARQLRWRTFDPSRVFRLPVVLGAIGLIDLVRHPGATVSAVDAAFLLLELVLAAAVGAAMGRLTVFRADPGVAGRLQSRTGRPGAALWLVLIAVRVGVDLLAEQFGSHLLAATGVILVVIAVSRAVSATVARVRAPRSPAGVGMIGA